MDTGVGRDETGGGVGTGTGGGSGAGTGSDALGGPPGALGCPRGVAIIA